MFVESRARRVLVAGMGWTTPLGDRLDLGWRRLCRGDSGIGADGFAAVTAVPASQPPAERWRAIARSAATAALADADATGDQTLGLVLGSSLGPHLDDAADTSPDALTAALGRELGLATEPVSVSTACSSGSDAIGLAATLVAVGAVDVCLCGGVDVGSAAKTLGHRGLGTLSATGPRPFDVDRDGIALGEGAAFLVLAAADRVGDRPVWGEVTGYGASNDACGLTAPDTTGAAAGFAVRRALAKAGIGPGDVGVVNAHGTGTRANDTAESACYAAVFGTEHRPTAFATKGAFGHTLGATGAIEAVALLLALATSTVPPVPGTTTVMPELTLPLPTEAAREVDAEVGLSLTLGFGGFNTCLALKRGTRTVTEEAV